MRMSDNATLVTKSLIDELNNDVDELNKLFLEIHNKYNLNIDFYIPESNPKIIGFNVNID